MSDNAFHMTFFCYQMKRSISFDPLLFDKVVTLLHHLQNKSVENTVLNIDTLLTNKLMTTAYD